MIFRTIFSCFYLLNFFLNCLSQSKFLQHCSWNINNSNEFINSTLIFWNCSIFLSTHACSKIFVDAQHFWNFFLFVLVRRRSIFKYNEWKMRFIVCEIFVMKIDDDVWTRSYFCSIQSLWNNINVVMFCSFY